tara:strand:- start:378 stop:1025 length:648 start_codon:yes stop_codon:yes gene_type:complete
MTKQQNAIKGSYKNLLNWFTYATEENKEYGSQFYYNAHMIGTEVGHELGYNGYDATKVGSAILAILSPRTDWDKNVGYAFEFVNLGWVNSQTKDNNNKCIAIMEGENPMDVMGRTSYKVKPFFKAILNPDGDNEVTDLVGFNKPTKLAVVDRHIGGAYFNRPLKEFQRYYLGMPKVTKRISGGCFRVAKELNIPVNIVQGVIWSQFRDEYKYFKY